MIQWKLLKDVPGAKAGAILDDMSHNTVISGYWYHAPSYPDFFEKLIVCPECAFPINTKSCHCHDEGPEDAGEYEGDEWVANEE